MQECIIEHIACLLQWLFDFGLLGFLGSYSDDYSHPPLQPPWAFPVICIDVFLCDN